METNEINNETPIIKNELLDLNLKAQLEEIFNEEFKFIKAIYDIFKEFFGEDRVDLLERNEAINSNEKIGTNLEALYKKSQDFPVWGSTPEELANMDENTKKLNKFRLYLKVLLTSTEYNILVFFPEVTITNEHDKSITIKELWAKIEIDKLGKGGTFRLNRSNYPKSHIISNYMHSHIRDIPFVNLTEFQHPCLGTGPIRDTIVSLEHNFDEDLWRLYCLELDKFIHTESLAGIPYHRLETISKKVLQKDICDYQYTGGLTNNKFKEIRDFTKYVLKQKVLNFTYVQDTITIAMSFYDCRVLLSNMFIEWYNNIYLKDNSYKTKMNISSVKKYILNSVVIKDGIFYVESNKHNEINEENYNGNTVIENFKGREIKLTVVNDIDLSNYSLLLDAKIVNYIITKILTYLNFNYEPYNAKTDPHAYITY